MQQTKQKTYPILTDFAEALRQRDRSAATVKHYLSDLRQFAAWFEARNGEPFALDAVAAVGARSGDRPGFGSGLPGLQLAGHHGAILAAQ